MVSTRTLTILLMGPTAAGKTALAVWLAQHLPIDIISVDSVMVYRGLDIGSGKPNAATLQACPHQLVDICEPTAVYSAAQFCADALRLIPVIHAKGRIPLLVGGTMLYFRALRQGLAALPSADPELRQRLEAAAAAHGWPVLHERLQAVDALTAARLHPHDAQRIQRALEVYELSGQPLSWWLQQQVKSAFDYPHLTLALAPTQRETLHRWIAERFNQMLNEGLLDEVRQLQARGDLHLGLPALRAVGYRQTWEYCAEGRDDLAALQERAVAATRQFAKRQYTWLRQEQQAHWLDSCDPTHPQQALHLIRQALA